MKKLILILGLIVLSCSVESEVEIQELNSDLSGISIKGSKNDKITICHFDADNNEWKTLNVNQNAMAAHLNHGDAIDADSDGFFDRENGCSPIDCDDDDSEVGECPTFDLEDGLIAWYPFNGNANDESGNGNDGVVYGASLTEDKNGKINSAYQFNVNATSSWGRAQQRIVITSPTIPEVNSFSMSSWIKLDSKPAPYNNRPHTILGRWNGNGSHVFRNQIYYDGIPRTNIAFDGTNSVTSSANSAIEYGIWVHFVVTYDGITCKQYVDGALVNEEDLNIQLNYSSSDLTIGELHASNGHWYHFSGIIDEVGYWSRALTDAKIQALYNETDSDLTN